MLGLILGTIMTEFDFDLFVIGGGSGGVRAARVAAGLGKKVGIAEEYRYGGTCVIRGCVPKKLFVYASHFSEIFEDAAGYGWIVGETSFDWKTLIANKDREIDRLEGLYRKGLATSGADIFDSRATFIDAHTIKLEKTGETVTAAHILVAVGGHPSDHPALPGHEHCIFSNEAFDLKALPKRIIIAGAGYIGVEFANIFHGLGVETTLIYRGAEILSGFDDDIRSALREEMIAKGIDVKLHTIMHSVTKRDDGTLDVALSDDQIMNVGEVMLAVGRKPNTKGLGLDAAGVVMDERGAIAGDDYSRTNVPHIFAVGDVTNRVQLTPVAIHESMCLIETVFKNNPTKPDHDLIATAVFSQPEIGTVGLSETDALKKYPDLNVFKASFRPMKNVLPGRNEKMVMKIIVDAKSDRVLGVHILGPDAGELAQVLGIALKAGVTKADFDRTMAVHPTAAEELVTMYKPTYQIRDGKHIS